MDPLIEALLQPEAYDHPVEEIQLLQTHISWILLTGPYAYKIKKPVDLGFVDFSTLARRRQFCQEELRLNRRLAPDLYVGLRSIHGPRERAHLQGSGPEIEVAVQMHQFCQQDLLPALLRRGLPAQQLLALIEDLGERLAAFHADAQVAPTDSDYGTAERVHQPALANLAVLERLRPRDPRLPPLRHWSEAEAQGLAELFEQRRRSGRVREAHGDLHLGNLVLHNGRIAVFDCLEFSASLRWIDVISDIAFLAMDLRRRRHSLLAAALLNRWLEASGDYPGLATWPWYVTYRALVRAKVTALRLEQQGNTAPELEGRQGRADLDAYLHLAGAQQRHHRRPLLLLTHGVTGSGKSHWARQLARRLGWLQIRSDVERRRLFGRGGEPCGMRLEGDPYSPAASERLYRERLSHCCRAALEAGFSVICDATFLKRWQRRHFQELASSAAAGFAILACPCSLELARARIARRRELGLDPSEADAAVLERQWQTLEPLDEQERALCLEARSSSPAEAPMAGTGTANGNGQDTPEDPGLDALVQRLRSLV